MLFEERRDLRGEIHPRNFSVQWTDSERGAGQDGGRGNGTHDENR
jgi:hypothetical protein